MFCVCVAVNWRGISHLEHLLLYIMDLFPKRGGKTFNTECREVSLMQRRCKEAECGREWITALAFICYFSISRCTVSMWSGHKCTVHACEGVCRTSLQDLLDLDVVGTETAVELEVVSVVEKGTPERKQ